MKKIISLLSLLLAVSIQSTCFSQDEPLSIETETNQGDQKYYENKYMYLDINLSDVDKLLKIGIQPFKPNDRFGFTVFTFHGGFEQKINRSISYINELNNIMMWSENETFHQLGYSTGARYYFMKKQEMAKGKSGDNCNGFYLHLKMSDLLRFDSFRVKGQDDGARVSNPQLERFLNYNIKPETGIGIQQVIRHHLYFDANISFNYDFRSNEPGFGITFLFGGLLSFTK